MRVAVASRSFSKHPILRAELAARYPEATFNDEGRSLSGPDLIAFLRGHERAITALERLDAALFDALPELTVVSKYGVGPDMVDLAAMQARGVRLGWTGGVNRRSVAELTISAAIALLHQVPQAATEVREGVWRQRVGRQLTGKTVGIVGCGHVGKEVARLARAFDCRVLSHELVDDHDFCRTWSVTPVGLDELLAESDVVTIHLPLTDLTRRMMDAKRLGTMRPGAVFINMARGGIVDESALVEVLTSGRLAGAAVDVFECEPPVDRRLIDLPMVIANPHIGGSAEEAIVAMGRAAIDGLESADTPAALGLLQDTKGRI